MGRDPHRFKRPESVLVVVYTQALDVLLLKRVPPYDFWQSVTGSLKWPDETPAAAARREVSEETGIRDAGEWTDWRRSERFEIHQNWTRRYGPGITENREHLFSLRLDACPDIVIASKEHVAYRWADFATAHELAWSWSNAKALKLIAQAEGLEVLNFADKVPE